VRVLRPVAEAVLMVGLNATTCDDVVIRGDPKQRAVPGSRLVEKVGVGTSAKHGASDGPHGLGPSERVGGDP
jgi:hypothetical protein